MPFYVVVEDPVDLLLLGKVLPSAADPDVRLLDGGHGSMSVVSMAGSIGSDFGQPVIAIVDARTVDEDAVEEQQDTTALLMSYSGAPKGSELLQAVPELEAVLFHDPEVIERLLGIEISEVVRTEARFIPRKVLARLIAQSGRFASEEELIAALGDEDARRLAQHPLIQKIECWIADIRAQPVPEEYRLRRTG